MSKIIKYMSNISRNVILSEKKSLRAAPKPCKGLVKQTNQNVNDVNDINAVNDVIDLNQHKLDLGLSKISSNDLPYNILNLFL
jgi:hypothetical protein